MIVKLRIGFEKILEELEKNETEYQNEGKLNLDFFGYRIVSYDILYLDLDYDIEAIKTIRPIIVDDTIYAIYRKYYKMYNDYIRRKKLEKMINEI